MEEKTKIYNQEFDDFSDENHLENEIIENEKIDEIKKPKANLEGYKTLGVGLAAGLGAGVLGTQIAFGNIFSNDEPSTEPSPIPENSFLAEILVNAKTPIATGITDEMSLEEAYASAREQIGPGGVFVWNGSVYGTYTEDEWSNLTDQQQNDYYSNFNLLTQASQQTTLFGDLQVSKTVNDDMSFGEAFAAARSELGAAGVFMWQGNAYNTFYKEEWAEMSQMERDDFAKDYLDIPDSKLIPTAATVQSIANNGTDTGQDNSEDRNLDDNYDIPVAVTNKAGSSDTHDFNSDDPSRNLADKIPVATEYSHADDDGVVFINQAPEIIINIPEADLKLLQGMESFGSSDVNALNNFINQHIHQGENDNQIYDIGDALPENFIADIGKSDDLVL